jgi:predicted nucleotidyltransferase
MDGIASRNPARVGGTMDSSSRLLFGSDAFGPLLAHLAATPGTGTSQAELERATGVSHESAFRALQRMVALGIVRRTARGRQVDYAIDTGHPLYPELKSLAAKAFGVGAELRIALAALPRGAIEQAFIFGSAAAGTDTAASDIDLFVVGRARLHDLSAHIAGVEARLGRRIQVICRTAGEVRAGLARGDSFYREVWSRPRTILIGADDAAQRAPDELAALFAP